jgi:hypothetical protein
MDKDFSAGGMALAAWTLLHVLLVHMRDTGALTEQTRRDLLDRALRACEAAPMASDTKVLQDARRLLEEWM